MVSEAGNYPLHIVWAFFGRGVHAFAFTGILIPCWLGDYELDQTQGGDVFHPLHLQPGSPHGLRRAVGVVVCTSAAVRL